MTMKSILLNKAGEKVRLDLDGTKVAIIENNNPFIQDLYISDNDIKDQYDIKLKYGEKMLVTSTVYLYHLNPMIKGRIKLYYNETTEDDTILKDFSSSGGGSLREIVLLGLKEEIRLENDRWTFIETLVESNLERGWLNGGVFIPTKTGYYQFKMTVTLESDGDWDRTFALRLVKGHDILAEIETGQFSRRIKPVLTLDYTGKFDEGGEYRLEAYQNSGESLPLIGKTFTAFGYIEYIDILPV